MIVLASGSESFIALWVAVTFRFEEYDFPDSSPDIISFDVLKICIFLFVGMIKRRQSDTISPSGISSLAGDQNKKIKIIDSGVLSTPLWIANVSSECVSHFPENALYEYEIRCDVIKSDLLRESIAILMIISRHISFPKFSLELRF